MGEEQKPKGVSQEQIAEAMKQAAANPVIMGQAAKMMNMGYAFQFSRMATPQAEIVPLGQVNEHLLRLHKAGAMILSVAPLPPVKGMDVLIAYYKLET